MQFACAGFLPALSSGKTVVTPSRLLAQVASYNFSRECLNNGLETWKRPEIHSIGAWLKICWQKARYSGIDTPALLSPPQEHALWQRIIQDETPGLFNVAETAALASRAARLLTEWHIPLDGDAWNEHEDGQQFRKWLLTFRAICNQEGWIGNFDLWRLAPKWIDSHNRGEAVVVFAGFSSIVPALLRLREALGSRAQDLQLERAAAAPCIPIRRHNDLAEEIETAARWARAAFARSSSKTTGVFVPDLGKNRDLVERTFEQVCYPAGFLSCVSENRMREMQSAYHTSAERPLLDHPLIAGALLLLRLAKARIPLAEASAALRSPWIAGAAAERNQRALADLELRRTRELDVSLGDLEFSTRHCPLFQGFLQRLRTVLRGVSPGNEFAAWSEIFSDILATTGWPGEDRLSSEEQANIESWKDQLSTLASLTLVSRRPSYEEALARLTSLLNETGSGTGDFFSPIQILDQTQAAGLRFDEVFVAGVSEGRDLFKPATSPLIPFKLQRVVGVPGSSPASLQTLRKQALLDLFSAVSNVGASYSERILPAAREFCLNETGEWFTWEGRTPKQSFAPADLESLADAKAPPYRPGNQSLGGTGLIKDQSQCPFRAFAVRRLNARSPEDGCFGLDSRDRGGFVHEALKKVWDQLKTQDALRKIRPFELKVLVLDAVRDSVPTSERGLLHEQLSIAEIDRLTEVVLAWLNVEWDRKQPFEVEVTEQKRILETAGLRLDIRIDRIDRLPNGKCVLIDYKSGDTGAANLTGDRPREPQLLAYAAAMSDEVEGFFFAQLKPRDTKLTGFARELHTKSQKQLGKNVGWNEFLEDRIAIVERLAQSFVAGESAVQPLPGACGYCDVKPFCRVNELPSARENEEDLAG